MIATSCGEFFETVTVPSTAPEPSQTVTVNGVINGTNEKSVAGRCKTTSVVWRNVVDRIGLCLYLSGVQGEQETKK